MTTDEPITEQAEPKMLLPHDVSREVGLSLDRLRQMMRTCPALAALFTRVSRYHLLPAGNLPRVRELLTSNGKATASAHDGQH